MVLVSLRCGDCGKHWGETVEQSFCRSFPRLSTRTKACWASKFLHFKSNIFEHFQKLDASERIVDGCVVCFVGPVICSFFKRFCLAFCYERQIVTKQMMNMLILSSRFRFQFQFTLCPQNLWTVSTVSVCAFTSMSFSSPLRNKARSSRSAMMRPPWSMPLRQSCNICTATYNRYQSNQCSKQLMSWTISHKTYPNINKYDKICFTKNHFPVSRSGCINSSVSQNGQAMARPWPGLCNFLRWKLVALNVPPWSFESGPCLAWMTHGIVAWSNLNLTVSRHVTSLTNPSHEAQVLQCRHVLTT